MTSGTDLRTARLLMGMTQAEMAAALNVTQQTVGRWEREGIGACIRRKFEIRLQDITAAFHAERARHNASPTKAYVRMTSEEKAARTVEHKLLVRKKMAEAVEQDAAEREASAALPSKGGPIADLLKPRPRPYDKADDIARCRVMSEWWTSCSMRGRDNEITAEIAGYSSVTDELPRVRAFIAYYLKTGFIPLDTNPECDHIFKE